MAKITTTWISYSSQIKSILRIVAALTFIMAGTVKLFAYPMGMPPNNSTAELFSEVGLAGILEVFGGFLLLIGLYTRPVAFLLSGEMAVAYWQVHAQISPWPVMNEGISPILYCFLFLYFSSAGAGVWSIDAMRGKPESV